MDSRLVYLLASAAANLDDAAEQCEGLDEPELQERCWEAHKTVSEILRTEVSGPLRPVLRTS